MKDSSLFICTSYCFLCAFVRLRISLPRKASGVKFCTSIHRRPRQGIFFFCELCSPEAQNGTNRPARHHFHDVYNDYPLAPEHKIARRVDVGSACVAIRQSPKTDVLVIIIIQCHISVLIYNHRILLYDSWLCVTVVESRFVTGELSLSYARPAADG